MMLASLTPSSEGNGYIARFERSWNDPAAEVWAYLTENEKLPKWFSELRIGELRKGGHLIFHMGNGSSLTMDILDYEPLSVLEFTWAEDVVRFELESHPSGCRLALIERLSKLTPHTPKDLAGWHVCLDVIKTLLDGQPVTARQEQWNALYPEYVQLVEQAEVGSR